MYVMMTKQASRSACSIKLFQRSVLSFPRCFQLSKYNRKNCLTIVFLGDWNSTFVEETTKGGKKKKIRERDSKQRQTVGVNTSLPFKPDADRNLRIYRYFAWDLNKMQKILIRVISPEKMCSLQFCILRKYKWTVIF